MIKNYKELRKQILSILHPIRLEIYSMLADNPGMNVTEIMIALRTLDQPAVSQHLMNMREAQILSSKKNGKMRVYRCSKKGNAILNKIKELDNEFN